MLKKSMSPGSSKSSSKSNKNNCESSSNGMHVGEYDLEYDPFDPPFVCVFCGENMVDELQLPSYDEILECLRVLYNDLRYIRNALDHSKRKSVRNAKKILKRAGL
jgi:hypothetical protein